MIQFNCANCRKRYKVKDDYQGSGDSLAALNKLLVALSDYETRAPVLELDDQ